MARESSDGKTAYLVGQYVGDFTKSPLFSMQTMWYSSDKEYQLLYLEENHEEMNHLLDEKGVSAITEEAYVIEESNLFWWEKKDSILVQPVDSAINFVDTFSIYHNPRKGRTYIEDALSRGIALNNISEPYLSVSMISERYGEITENIPLTEDMVSEILSSKKMANLKEKTESLSSKKMTDFKEYGFSATLHKDGEFIYYSEKNVPQLVVNLAVERCGYKFASPADLKSAIQEAYLVCNWLEEPIFLEKEYLKQLHKILTSAKLTGVGNCGYGAKLVLTLENGEKMTIFKGTDDCGSLVFGSQGGYSIGEKEDDEFWEMFGLMPNAEERLKLK